jgi:hypothetical protein
MWHQPIKAETGGTLASTGASISLPLTLLGGGSLLIGAVQLGITMRRWRSIDLD